MKKSKYIKLVLVAASLSSCGSNEKPKQKVYMRSDSTATYSQARPHGTYYSFIPYGYFIGSMYMRSGYYSSGISRQSNTGTNAIKRTGTTRGGFGRSGFRSSS